VPRQSWAHGHDLLGLTGSIRHGKFPRPPELVPRRGACPSMMRCDAGAVHATLCRGRRCPLPRRRPRFRRRGGIGRDSTRIRSGNAILRPMAEKARNSSKPRFTRSPRAPSMIFPPRRARDPAAFPSWSSTPRFCLYGKKNQVGLGSLADLLVVVGQRGIANGSQAANASLSRPGNERRGKAF